MLYEVITIAKGGADRAKVRDYLVTVNAAKPYMGIGGKTVFDAKGDCEKPAFRITSYNVCYTKLLRSPCRPSSCCS